MKLQTTFGKITGVAATTYSNGRGVDHFYNLIENAVVAGISCLTVDSLNACEKARNGGIKLHTLLHPFLNNLSSQSGCNHTIEKFCIPRRDSVMSPTDGLNVHLPVGTSFRRCDALSGVDIYKDAPPNATPIFAYRSGRMPSAPIRTDYKGIKPWEQDLLNCLFKNDISSISVVYKTDYGFLVLSFMDNVTGSLLQEIRVTKDSVTLRESRWRTDTNGHTVRFGSRKVERDVSSGVIKEVRLNIIPNGDKKYYTCGKTVYRKTNKSNSLRSQSLELLYLNVAIKRKAGLRRNANGEVIEYTQRRKFTKSRCFNKCAAVITAANIETFVGMRTDSVVDLRHDGKDTTLNIVVNHPDMHIDRKATLLTSDHPDMNFWKMITTESVFPVSNQGRLVDGMHTFSSSYASSCLPMFIALGFEASMSPLASLNGYIPIHPYSAEYLYVSTHYRNLRTNDSFLRYTRGLYSDALVPANVVGRAGGCVNVNPWLAATNSDDSFELSNFMFTNLGKGAEKLYAAFRKLHTDASQKSYKEFLREALPYYEDYAKGYLRCLAGFSHLTDPRGAAKPMGIRTHSTPFMDDMFGTHKNFKSYAGTLDAYTTDINIRVAEDAPTVTVGCSDLVLML